MLLDQRLLPALCCLGQSSTPGLHTTAARNQAPDQADGMCPFRCAVRQCSSGVAQSASG